MGCGAAKAVIPWIKAPSLNGHAMETGPLAQACRLVDTLRRDASEQTNWLMKPFQKAGVPIQAMFSTLGRTLLASMLRSSRMMASREMLRCVDELEANIKAG